MQKKHVVNVEGMWNVANGQQSQEAIATRNFATTWPLAINGERAEANSILRPH